MRSFLEIMDAAQHIDDARAAERRSVNVRALVREAGSARVDIDLVDLSVTGFRFESFYGFAVGTRVFLTIPSLQPLEAAIAWRGGSMFGCRFIVPLHLAVFETIAARFGWHVVLDPLHDRHRGKCHGQRSEENQ